MGIGGVGRRDRIERIEEGFRMDMVRWKRGWIVLTAAVTAGVILCCHSVSHGVTLSFSFHFFTCVILRDYHECCHGVSILMVLSRVSIMIQMLS